MLVPSEVRGDFKRETLLRRFGGSRDSYIQKRINKLLSALTYRVKRVGIFRIKLFEIL